MYFSLNQKMLIYIHTSYIIYTQASIPHAETGCFSVLLPTQPIISPKRAMAAIQALGFLMEGFTLIPAPPLTH